MANILDIESFIMEVQLRPAIWDPRCPSYGSKLDKKKAWDELCLLFVPNFAQMDLPFKNQAIRQLQRKWKSLRDCYTRELSKIKKLQTGSAVSIHKQYVYFQHLAFLASSCDPRAEFMMEPEEGDMDGLASFQFEAEPEQSTTESMGQAPRKRSLAEGEGAADGENKKLNSQKEGDPDRYFLLSLIPHFRRIPQHYKLDAQFEIMNIVKKYSLPNHVSSSADSFLSDSSADDNLFTPLSVELSHA